MLAAELENEMAEMAEGEGDEQDFEDEMADVCFCFLFCYCNLCYVIVEHLKMTKKTIARTCWMCSGEAIWLGNQREREN